MNQFTDVLVVGTGVAGLFCALHLPQTTNVCMVTKQGLEESDSFLAQGGMCVLREEADYPSYFEDTMKAGHYENNPMAVDAMIRGSAEVAEELQRCGVAFDYDEKGLHYTCEGAHSAPRILHHKDITGKEITSQLLRQAKKRPNITMHEHTTMLDILSDGGKCTGAVLRQPNGGICVVYARAVVLATGGVGGLFESSTNYAHLTGDSVAIAIKHGIARRDANYVQIHPTTLYSPKKGRRFLLSESMRGEGAWLLNHWGKRFVDELLPRDILTAAIHKQMEQSKKPYVWLSVTHLGEKKIKQRFPNIYDYCFKEGYDITIEPIPVTPAQHYYMGGVAVDLDGRTSLPGLYAAGETACNGVHGKNRLASNSLLESLVFAKRSARCIAQMLPKTRLVPTPCELSPYMDRDALQSEYKKLVLAELKREHRKDRMTECFV